MANLDRDLDRLEATANKMLLIIAKLRTGTASLASNKSSIDAVPIRRGRRPSTDKARSKLGPAERRVFDGLLKGLTAKEIAAEIEKSLSTVNNQTARIFRAFEVKSRQELRNRFGSR